MCGAAGTGKTTTAWEIGHRLIAAGVPHAVLDTDELDRVWPRPDDIERLVDIARRNLAAFWRTYAELGTERLVLAGVMAALPMNRAWIEAAIPGARVTFVRLRASRATREERLQRRELGTGFERDLRHSDVATGYVEEHDPADMLVVVTDGKSVVEVADEVLSLAGWLEPGGR